jgi:hypothetical protein
MSDYYIANGELRHYGVPGMKWGVLKSEYKSMTRKQKKEAKRRYYNTPEGRIERITKNATYLGGPIAGIIANRIATKKFGDMSKSTITKGESRVKKFINKKYETDEQKITRLISEGKIGPNAHHYFDQNGNLMMVTWDD